VYASADNGGVRRMFPDATWNFMVDATLIRRQKAGDDDRNGDDLVIDNRMHYN
jgi:hypothetical protein